MTTYTPRNLAAALVTLAAVGLGLAAPATAAATLPPPHAHAAAHHGRVVVTGKPNTAGRPYVLSLRAPRAWAFRLSLRCDANRPNANSPMTEKAVVSAVNANDYRAALSYDMAGTYGQWAQTTAPGRWRFTIYSGCDWTFTASRSVSHVRRVTSEF